MAARKLRGMFRQAALDRLASPEQLDQLMEVTTPRHRMGLVAVGTLLFLAVLWSIWGVLPSRVSGKGILINEGGVFVATARSDGHVSAILVREGQMVTNQQVMARLKLPELELKIAQGTIARDRLKEELVRLREYQEREERGEREAQAQQTATYQAMIQDFERQIEALKGRVSNLQELLTGDSPAVSRVQLLETQNILFLAQHDLARTQILLKQVELDRLQSVERRRQQSAQKETELLVAEQDLDYQVRLHELNAEIRSPFRGTVIEVMIKPGQLINPNTSVMTLQKSEELLEAWLFLGPADGKQVREGMEVQLEPVSVKRELYGLMRGTVKSVSRFPARPDAMLRILENSTLVEEFSRGGAPISVVVSLERDLDTASGYRWTSGKGPAGIAITSGTLCEGSVTVTNRRPISLVLPFLQQQLNW